MSVNARSGAFVLVVDDEPDRVDSDVKAGVAGRAEVEVVHPSEVRGRHLERADLVLVDYRLDDWPTRDGLESASVRPETGLALAAVLREAADRSKGERPTAFGLHTARLSEARGRLRLAEGSARHVVARLNNLEWVFQKTDSGRYGQIVVLADAVRELPAEWPGDEEGNSGRVAQRLLGLEEGASWYERSWRDVRECRPPIHETAGSGRGVVFVRWLLHEIIPYPCFLWDLHWVAARLRLPVRVLQQVAGGDSRFAERLKAIRYNGLLEGFLGDRWWRSGVEHYRWELGRGDEQRFRRRAEDEAGEGLEWLDCEDPVVTLDAELEPSGAFVSTRDAVNVRPDHWPAFADLPWVEIQTVVDSPALRAMVDPLDEYRLPE